MFVPFLLGCDGACYEHVCPSMSACFSVCLCPLSDCMTEIKSPGGTGGSQAKQHHAIELILPQKMWGFKASPSQQGS